MIEPRRDRGGLRPFGLMFHYFHGIRHPQAQGTISASQFEQIIDYFMSNARLLQADVWAVKADYGSLENGEVCVTFDDALRSQFDIALPVLRQKGLTAFWFVQSGVLTGEAGLLEAFRRFRNEYFASIRDFYESFYSRLSAVATDRIVRRISVAVPDDYLQEFPFYTAEDRKFRYVRDRLLQPHEYVEVMKDLIRSRSTSVEELSAGMTLDAACLRILESEGHVIGLHSHSHPTCLADLPKDEQRREYETNFEVLSGILAAPPFTAAHPCNSYSAGTLEILRSLGIRIGFRSNMAMSNYSNLEFPRKDSAALLSKVAG